jgi:endonuclease YncB( thermonuclease family)
MRLKIVDMSRSWLYSFGPSHHRLARGVGAALTAGLALAAVSPASAQQSASVLYPGPFQVEVVRVIDGDTVAVRAHVWPDQVITTAVRLLDIDTPELRGRCEAEVAAAERARAFVADAVQRAGGRLWLRDVVLGKYAGRVIGRLMTPQGEDIGEALIQGGLAVPYSERNAQRERLCGRS